MSDSQVVFLPGTLCDERVFQYQLPLFPGARVVDLRHSLTMEEMVAKVEAVDASRLILIGFSMGGHVAQEFTLKYPKLVERLVVMGSSSQGYPAQEKEIVLKSLPLIERGRFSGISDKRLHDYLHPSSYLNADLRKLIQDMAGEDAKEVYLRQIRATLERRDLSAEMKSLEVPILFIAGMQDQIVPVETVRRSAVIAARGTFLGVEECGHFVPLEKPSQVNESILEFLAN